MITIRPEKIESDIYNLFEKEFSTWVKREGYILNNSLTKTRVIPK